MYIIFNIQTNSTASKASIFIREILYFPLERQVASLGLLVPRVTRFTTPQCLLPEAGDHAEMLHDFLLPLC